MGVIDDILAKQRAENPPPKIVPPVRRYMNPARLRKKLRGTPSFYLEYFAKVAVEMQRQDVPHFNPEQDAKKGGGLLSPTELDAMDDYAERDMPASEFVAWVRTQRGL